MKAAAILALVLWASIAAAYPVPVDDSGLQRAVDWLRSRTRDTGCVGADVKGTCGHASTRDALIALSAAGIDVRTWGTPAPSPVDYLRGHRAELEAETSGCPACLWAKTIVALEAAGEDPRDFGGFDYVARLDAFFDGVQVGEPRQINDDAWALYAYSGLDAPERSKVEAIRTYLAARQNPGDGGWSWSLGVSEAWGTATALMSLLESGTPATHASVGRALTFLHTQQGPSGLILQDGGDSAESTAIAIQAIRRSGQDPSGPEWKAGGRDLVTALLALQAKDGSFSHNPQGGSRFIATTQTLPALRGVPYPFRPPAGTLTLEPPRATAGSNVVATIRATDPDGRIVSRDWKVDGEARPGAESISLRFDTAGSHAVRVTVTDDEGVARTYESVLVVDASRALNETVAPSPVEVVDGSTVSETARPLETAGAAPNLGAVAVLLAMAGLLATGARRRHR